MELMIFEGRCAFVNVLALLLIGRISFARIILDTQFLGCFREALDKSTRETLYPVRGKFEECADYCIFMDTFTFGITDDGSCACMDGSYDAYNSYINNWCVNPCVSDNYYHDGFSCGGGVIFMSYYRNCPPFTFGLLCENYCMCRSSICHSVSGVCYGLGCLGGVVDTSPNSSLSFCYEMKCNEMNGTCLTVCQSNNPSYSDLLNCTCDTGFEFNPLSFACSDVNECSKDMTSDCDKCINTIGSYICSCNPPFKVMILDEKETCHPPAEYHHNCSSCRKDQECRAKGNIIECVCPHGSDSHGNCHKRITCSDLAFCHNCNIDLDTVTCKCHPGYELVDFYMCKDINECENMDCIDCVNFPGLAFCQCPGHCRCDIEPPTCDGQNVGIHISGYASTSNKAIHFFTHHSIGLGVFLDAPSKLSSNVKSSWQIPGLLNRTTKGTFLRIPDNLIRPGNYTATIQFSIFSRKRQVKIYFVISLLTEYNLVERGVIVLDPDGSPTELEIQPFLKHSEWACSFLPLSGYLVYADTTPSCNVQSGSVPEDNFLVIQNFRSIRTSAEVISFYFRKEIRVNQIAYDMVTYIVPSSLATVIECLENCGAVLNVNEDLVLRSANVFAVPAESFYFYWHFDEAKFYAYGIGVDKFTLPAEKLWKLENKEYTIYLKRTILLDREALVYKKMFMTRSSFISRCTLNVLAATSQLKEMIIKTVLLRCEPNEIKNFLWMECNSADFIWLYRGSDNEVKFTVALDDNLQKRYCIREVAFRDGTENEVDFPINILSNEGVELDLESEMGQIKGGSLALHELTSKIYAIVTAMNSKMKIKLNGALIVEYVEQRNDLASFLHRALKNSTHYVDKPALVVMTKSLELLTRYIEGVKIKQTRYYNVADYILKFKDLIAHEGTNRSDERLCTKEQYLRLTLQILANLLSVHFRESEIEQEVSEISLAKELLKELKVLVRSSLGMVQKEMILIPNNISMELDHLDVRTFHLDGLTVGDTIVVSNSAAGEKYKISFMAPSTNLSLEVALIGYTEINDNNLKIYVSPLTVNLTDKLTGADVDPENGYEVIYFLPGHFDPVIYEFAATSVRMILITSPLNSNGTSIFQASFHFFFYSEELITHNVYIIMALCPEDIYFYDDKSLDVSCIIISKDHVSLSKSGDWGRDIYLHRKDYVTNTFKIIIALENLFKNLVINASFTVNKMACLSLKENIWKYNCKGKLLSNDYMSCHCPISQEYSAFKMNIPVHLSTSKSLETKYMGLYLIMCIWFFGIMLGMWAARTDSYAELVAIPVDLSDNPLRGLYCYMVIINTGNVMNAGAFNSVYLTLIGSMNNRTINCLKTCFFPVLRRGEKNVFIMRSKQSLGHILIIRLWHRGLESYSNWFVHDIKVIDLQTQSSYYFLCYSWVGTNYIGWNSSLLAIIVTYEDFHRINHLLPHNMYRYIQFKHRLLSIFFMPGTDSFTRFDRVISLCFRVTMVVIISLLLLEKGFDVGKMYITMGGVEGHIVVSAFYSVLYTSIAMFFVDLALLTMRWQSQPVIFAKDNILTTQRGVEVTSLRIVNNVLRLILHIIRPRDAAILVEDIEVGQSFMGNTFFLRMKFFLRLFSPGVFVILSVFIILSIFLVLWTVDLRHDRMFYWAEMMGVSILMTFFVADTLECLLVVVIFSFILKSEIHPEVINTERILYAIRRELADASGLILADAIATRRKNIKYKRPLANQFTSYTRANNIHGIVGLSRYFDILFAIVFLSLLMCFFHQGLVGPSIEVTEINLVISRSFRQDMINQIYTKDDFWSYIENVVLSQLHSTENQTDEDNSTEFFDPEKFFHSNHNDSEITEFSKKSAFWRSIKGMFILSNSITYSVRGICLKVLSNHIYAMVIVFEEIQPINWDSYCFSRNKTENLVIFKKAISMSSLHKNVRGIALKLFLYTPSVSVFSMVTLATVNMPTGKIRTRMEIINRKFNSFEELNKYFQFFCFFLGIIFLLIITFLLHVYYDGYFAFLITFRYFIQTLSLGFGFLFIFTIIISLLEKYYIYVSRAGFFGITFTHAAEKLNSMAFLLTVFFTTLRPLMFFGRKLHLTKYYWNGTYTHLHQAYILVIIIFIGQGVTYLWSMKKVYRISTAKRSIFLSAVNIFHAGNLHKLAAYPWTYFNIITFIIIHTIVKGVIFTGFFYKKDWKDFVKSQQVGEEPES